MTSAHYILQKNSQNCLVQLLIKLLMMLGAFYPQAHATLICWVLALDEQTHHSCIRGLADGQCATQS